jgi:hypothetical protein
MAQDIPNRGCRRAALMRMRAMRMAQPVGPELPLQPGRLGGRGEDLADALIAVIAMIRSSGSLSAASCCKASQVRRPTRIVRAPCVYLRYAHAVRLAQRISHEQDGKSVNPVHTRRSGIVQDG